MNAGKILIKFLCLLGISLTSCVGVEDRCAKLEFTNSFESVQKGILEIDSTIKYFNARCGTQYEILLLQDTVFIRDRNKSDKYEFRTFCSASETPLPFMEKTAHFMKENNIDAIYKEGNLYVYDFNYCNPNEEFELVRFIIIDEKNVRSRLRGYKVLDVKEKLLLIALR